MDLKKQFMKIVVDYYNNHVDVTDNKTLTEDDVYHISNAIKTVPTLADIELIPIRRIANQYKYNPKRVSFNRYAITIDIYDDVRIIRFNELSERKEQIDDEDTNTFG